MTTKRIHTSYHKWLHKYKYSLFFFKYIRTKEKIINKRTKITTFYDKPNKHNHATKK
jgi:hypothetical protein